MHLIRIRGVRTHNLKNINLDLPRDKLIVTTGLSGSGKSSLVFDTLYAEGQRRYVESLSTYARQFLSVMERPEMDLIEGLSPAIAIEQKSSSHNPRSTVGTITEIYDYMRLLFARVGQPRCPEHGISLEAEPISQMVDRVLSLPEGTRITLLAPVVRERKGEHRELLRDLLKKGFIRAKIDGVIIELEELPSLALNKKHTVEVVIDRLKVEKKHKQRLAESFETALRLTDGIASVWINEENNKNKEKELIFSSKFACPQCSYTITALEPRFFSFNSPSGACSYCDGLGTKELFDPEKIVRNPKLSLSEGAVAGRDKHNKYYFTLLTSLAKYYKFDLNLPFCQLPKKIKQIILYGNNGEIIPFRYLIGTKRPLIRRHAFEGIIPNMKRRYQESGSLTTKEELIAFLSSNVCPECQGTRLQIKARNVFINEKNISKIAALSVAKALDFFKNLNLKGQRKIIAEKILEEICDRLQFLINVGLDYLSLDRSSDSLSGGEAQRIRLASQIGSKLVGVIYILDEPTIGLHQRDNQKLLSTLLKLRDLGNTVIVVEHDAEMILNADHVIDMGPGAGLHGGQIIFHGSPKELLKNKASLTGQYLSNAIRIETPKARASPKKNRYLVLKEVFHNNLKNIDIKIPAQLFVCITGVSGSGKSSLVNDILYRVAARKLNRAQFSDPKNYRSISGLNLFDKVINIDQSPIGRTPRSNPATYTGLFTFIRELFSKTSEACIRGYSMGRFSFNLPGGRCEACQGEGLIKVEMHFMPDIYVTCDVCEGKRYNRETLEIYYKGKNIHEVLSMTVEEAEDFFAAIPPIRRKLRTLTEVGLSYINLGQSAITLSGGEAQRIKLSKELSRRDSGKTLYILDEPTTGLHFHDIKRLLHILHQLRNRGNTIVVIEHNLDVIKTADWIIDLGPEGGEKGGYIVAQGTPEKIARCKNSYTGQFLKKHGILKNL